ncbi:aldehyde dehydrogenase (NADP(+)) [Microbacterium oryzae]|uniref:Aldehyde dehydrogenase (NADP(+)) n=1 Tax=Microbacterium oryzae TaxID=743009 RepID=A0A6I6E3X6_9MICO|nr:aldehyde dehydrogenase (NADP(+)) [Microbacterium oryzae]QGU27477.1 aldehyde dehydrogenase (NADP(+)) [Microbacterium oryzae]
MTELTGHSFIAGERVVGTSGTTYGINAETGERLEPGYSLLDVDQVATATAAAAEAFPSFSSLEPEKHAAFLESVADRIDALGDELIERTSLETGLTAIRLTGERTRTSNQLRLFAKVVRQGDFRGVRIDPAIPDRTPLPRVDIRQRKVALGPVAVFGASNFPFAFSTAGGDTAAALAAGCPVVFKAHNAHPATSELVGTAIAAAVAEHGLHPGVFSLVYGPGSSVGQALVADPVIQAVGFTGSRSGGLSILATAQSRPVPIPVYAEMSSVNPVFILPGSLEGDVEKLAADYVTSLSASSGQLCTQPGIVFVPRGEAGDRFLAESGRILGTAAGQVMLTPGMARAWREGVDSRAKVAGVELIAAGSDGPGENAPAPVIHGVDASTFLSEDELQEEIFGAASLVVRYDGAADLAAAAARMEGQLTATIHLTETDHEIAAQLLPVLEHRVGRILANGWPTGVEVGHAMVHGGPFPATSDSRTTSVGTLAIERFLRPVAYQNIPDALLPPALRDANPWHLNRRIDGDIQLSEKR